MDKKELLELEKIDKMRAKNFSVFRAVAAYLNNFPCLVTKEIMDEIGGGVAENEEYAFAIFLANALSEDEGEIEIFEREYFKRSVKQLDLACYYDNPFYKNIKIPKVKDEEWELGYQSYEPYEGFIWDDIIIDSDYREIPQIGFFREKFSFPTVFENGVEWMAIKPNEIETMKPHLEKMRGDVCVFGLGIGYFAYMASLKPEVKSITIVERDKSVIRLFEKHILPQFENKDKIKIVIADAIDYAREKMINEHFDCAFVDLWHDVSDGVDIYTRMKKAERINKGVEFCYWIEKSLLSNIRWFVFETLYKNAKEGKWQGTLKDLKEYISFEYLREFYKYLL
ncbi:MAG: hypothetical protein IJ309_01130 [Clostridia bacterium]|nr:hypothetical protein [Clostridia bacterium]